MPLSPFALNLSQQQSLFQWSALHIRWSKYWSFNFSPSNEYSGLISLGLTGLISFCPRDSQESSAAKKHHNLKTSILWGSAFFMVQLSHLYTTAGKTNFCWVPWQRTMWQISGTVLFLNTLVLGWPKHSFRFFCKMFQPQKNILANPILWRLIFL